MCLWKRERTYLFLPFVTTLVRQPHYAGGKCADKLEEYTAVLGNRVSLDSIAGTYNGARSGILSLCCIERFENVFVNLGGYFLVELVMPS